MKSYYDPAHLARIPELIGLAPESAGAFLGFEREVYQDRGILEPKVKELIAAAVAHVTGCPYCIDVHVRKSRALGATQEELMEAILVAASTRAGAVLSHAAHMLIAYEQADEGSAAVSGPPHGPAKHDADRPAAVRPADAGPECFC